MDVASFRALFPVFAHISYLNAGTAGPAPRAALEAAAQRLADVLEAGRTGEVFWEELGELAGELRSEYAARLGCRVDEVALMGSTTDGINTVIAGLDLHAGDEVLTTDEEHPGVLAPLGAARLRPGIDLRVVPFDALPDAVTTRTRLVVCSHVSWITGRVMDTSALGSTGAQVLLDGAQALGAVPVDVRTLGCDFYAAPGHKWLCGADGTGCLFVRSDRVDSLALSRPHYFSVADPFATPELVPFPGARRFDVSTLQGVNAVWSLVALDVLDSSEWPWILDRGPKLASRLARRLEERGANVAPRGDSTLVSWHVDDPAAVVRGLAENLIAVRDIPRTRLVRASIGAWTTDEELERVATIVSDR